MRVIVTANQVPFIRGGAEYHAENLVNAIREHGHEVELVRFPFKFSPESFIDHQMEYCKSLDFSSFNGHQVDRLISLQFPGFGIQHDHHRVWVMHQHRAMYELYDESQSSEDLNQFRSRVHNFDTEVLGGAEKLFANSENVASRLYKYNQLKADPLYHPPPAGHLLQAGESWDYIFYPSRLESLKRQTLLIEAAQFTQTDVKIIIAGDGGQKSHYQSLVDQLGVADKVRLIGAFSDEEKIVLYKHALGVFFGPYDEDYGYITLEAMLAEKPVITCKDSGGPLEFVVDEETGLVCEPQPQAIAAAIDSLYADKQKAKKMGMAGKQRYQDLNINWHTVVKSLLD